MNLDLRDLKPSDARKLGEELSDKKSHPAFIDELCRFLSAVELSQPSWIDHTVALSHELGSIGIWDKIDWNEFSSKLSTVRVEVLKAFLKASPIDLEVNILQRAAMRAHRGVRQKSKSSKRGGLKASPVFRVSFKSHQVADTLVVSGVNLSNANLKRLVDLLHTKTKVYLRGMECTSIVKLDEMNEFTIGEIVSSQRNFLGNRSSDPYGALVVSEPSGALVIKGRPRYAGISVESAAKKPFLGVRKETSVAVGSFSSKTSYEILPQVEKFLGKEK